MRSFSLQQTVAAHTSS